MHFWLLAARVYSRRSLPRNTSLNWFMPAFVNNNDGSSCGTSDELGTTRWPFCSKYSKNDARISVQVIGGDHFTVGLQVRLKPDTTYAANGCGCSGRGEPLPNKVSDQLLTLFGFHQPLGLTAQPPVKRLVDDGVLVLFAEQLADHLFGQVAVDLHGQELAHDAMRTVTPHACLCARDRRGGATIVDGAIRNQALHGWRDRSVGVSLISEAGTYLRFGQLTRAQPAQRAEVRGFR